MKLQPRYKELQKEKYKSYQDWFKKPQLVQKDELIEERLKRIKIRRKKEIEEKLKEKEEKKKKKAEKLKEEDLKENK